MGQRAVPLCAQDLRTRRFALLGHPLHRPLHRARRQARRPKCLERHGGTTAAMMPLAQKLVARAAGRGSVTPGEIVTCKVDLAMMHDSGGPRRVKPMLERLGARWGTPPKALVTTNNTVPTSEDAARKTIPTAPAGFAEPATRNSTTNQATAQSC